MDNSEGSIEFKIKSEELFFKDEVDDLAHELTTTEENNDLSDNDDTTNKLMSEENKLSVEEEDDSEGSVAFKIKLEELFIKNEVDDPAYELTRTEENNDSSEDQREFVVIKSDVGPPHHIFDRFTNILITVDSSICCIEDLNKILTCCVGLVNLPENVASSKIQINPKKQDINGPSNSAILGQAQHKCGAKKRKPCKCKECHKTFNDKSNLKKHMLIHEGKRPYKCQECQKQFTQKTTLTMHMLVHEGKRPYQCQECQKMFSRNSSLRRHIFIHEDKKAYKCRECQKQFIRKDNLKQHMLIHESKRPYECEECKKLFTYESNLTQHMLIHGSKRP